MSTSSQDQVYSVYIAPQTLSAVYAGLGLFMVIFGCLIAWKKREFLWPFVILTCSFTTVIILIDVCSTDVLFDIALVLTIIIGLVVAFRGTHTKISLCVSSAIVLAFFISPSFSIPELFLLLCVGSLLLTLTATFSLPKLGLYFVGAAMPIGVIDSVFNVIDQRYLSLYSVFSTDEAIPMDLLSVFIFTAALSVACGFVSHRVGADSIFVAQMTCVTGSFFSSLMISILFIGDRSAQDLVWMRLIVGFCLSAWSWCAQPKPESTPQVVQVALPTKDPLTQTPVTSFNNGISRIV